MSDETHDLDLGQGHSLKFFGGHPAQNTDRELWREAPDYYAPSVFVTQGGAIGMNVGGFVRVMSVRGWHGLQAENARLVRFKDRAWETTEHLEATVAQLRAALTQALARFTEHEEVDVAAAFHEWLKRDDPYALTRAIDRVLRDRREVAERVLATTAPKEDRSVSDDRLEQLKATTKPLTVSDYWYLIERLERVEAERDRDKQEMERLEEAIRRALDELGVPGEGYPAPVVEAVTILQAALGEP